MKPTECQCPMAGYCKTLKRPYDPPEGRKMTETRWNECKNKPHYFEMFYNESENGDKPSQLHSQPHSELYNTPCQHRGEFLRAVPCKPCNGKKTQDIYSCELHEECSWTHGVRSEGMKGKLVKSCQHCNDYEPLTERDDAVS